MQRIENHRVVYRNHWNLAVCDCVTVSYVVAVGPGGQHTLRPGVTQHEVHPVYRRSRVHRYVSATRLHHRQQCHHQVDRAGHRDCHQGFRPHPLRHQQSSKAVCSLVEFAVRNRQSAAAHRHGITGRQRRAIEEIRQRILVCSGAGGRGRNQQPAEIAGQNHVEITDDHRLVLGHGADHSFEARRDARHRHSIENICCITETGADTSGLTVLVDVLHHTQLQIEFRNREIDVERANRQFRQVEAQSRIGLEFEEYLKQR